MDLPVATQRPTGTTRATASSAVVRRLGRASLVVVTTVLLTPALITGPFFDAAGFVLVGERIRAGAMPYRDMWDNKPPGTFMLHAATQSLAPWADPWGVAWAVSVVFLACAALLVYELLCQRVARHLAWMWTLAFAALVSNYMVGAAGSTETFAVLPLTAAAWLVVDRTPSKRRSGAAGLLLGLAGLFSLIALPGALAVSLAAVAGSSRVGEWRGIGWRGVGIRFGALVTAGALLPLLAVAWLAAGGALADAYDAVIAFAGPYRESGLAVGSALIGPLSLVGFCIPTAVVAIARLRSRPRWGSLETLSIVWIAAFILFTWYVRRFYPHYLILVAPPVVLLAALGSMRVLAWFRAGRPSVRIGASVLIACIVALLLWAGTVATVRSVDEVSSGLDSRQTVNDVAAAVDRMTKPGDTIFVWGDSPEVYLASGRTPATRFIYQLPTVTPLYWSPDRSQKLAAQLAVHPPAVIVEMPARVPLLRVLPSPSYIAVDTLDYDTLEPLRMLVREQYRIAAVVDGLNIYAPIERAP